MYVCGGGKITKRYLIATMIFILMGTLLISSTSASSVGTSDLTKGKVVYESPVITNYSIVNTNASDYWDGLDKPNATQFNYIDGILSIDLLWLTNLGNSLWCALTGCTMTGDLNMSDNDIIDVGTISADNYVGLPGEIDNDFHTYFNGSAYNNIIYNLTDGDAVDVESQINPGKKFIFGEVFT